MFDILPLAWVLIPLAFIGIAPFKMWLKSGKPIESMSFC